MKIQGKFQSLNEDFEKYLDFNLKMLWYMGIVINLNSNNGVNGSRFLERLPTFTTNIMGIIDGFFQILWIMDAWTYDKHLVTQISSNFLSNITAICKGFRLATTVESLQSILNEMAQIWKINQSNDESRKKFLKRASKTLFFCKCYAGIGIGVVVSWGIPPLQNFFFQYLAREATNHTYDYSQRIFMVRYPFAINTTPIYFSVLFEEQWVLFGSALSWICCDALFAQLTSHVCLQLEILQYDIENLINREINEINLKANLIIIAKRHRDLLRICELVDDIFSPVVFTTTMISSLNLCVNVFELREMVSKSQYSEAAIHTFLLMSIFLQIVVYCTFAESLTEQTNLVADAVYNSKWPEKNHKFRTYLQIFILKSQHPFYCTAYGFFPIGHVQLTKIVKGAMSYYMYLQTTS